MDLQNMLHHMKGQSVSVLGHRIQIDETGLAKDVPQEAAARLLKNADAWRQYQPPRARRGAAPPKPGPAAKPPAPPAPAPEPEPEPELESAPAPEPEPEDVVVEVIPGEGEDWPDPQESMSAEYLRKMADAYEVKYRKSTGKAKLVKAIHKAMYAD
jgi:hypothetical protein